MLQHSGYRSWSLNFSSLRSPFASPGITTSNLETGVVRHSCMSSSVITSTFSSCTFSFFFLLSNDSFSLLWEIRALFSYLVTGIAWLTVGAQYFLVTGQLSCALTTIMSCRFILNLYQAYHKPFRASTDSSHTRSIWAMSAIICGVHFLDLPASESSPSRASIAEQACQVTGAIAEQNEGGELEQG